ncbi:MAG: hypothetical protein GXP35_13575 [Actinobacteria bacterium]|nr:hypothetical protein [Actinomycetota bacterium]
MTDVTSTVGAEARITSVIDALGIARPMPLSASVVVNRDELMGQLEAALAELPDEVRAARWLLKERDEYLDQARTDAAEIVNEASRQVEQMVQRTAVVRQAETRAKAIVTEAEADGRHKRRETEDWCEQRLAQFDITLTKISEAVKNGRERLSELPRAERDDVIDLTSEDLAIGTLIFDQDDFG